MKRITAIYIIILLLHAGAHAQTSGTVGGSAIGIDEVLRRIEANNQELQANAHSLAAQKLENARRTTSPTRPSATPTSGARGTRARPSANWSCRKVSTSPPSTPRAPVPTVYAQRRSTLRPPTSGSNSSCVPRSCASTSSCCNASRRCWTSASSRPRSCKPTTANA